MNWSVGKTGVWLWVTLATAAMAFAAGQAQVQLPEGEGKKILEASCTGCHDLAGVMKYKGVYKQKEWQDLVVNMIGYGAGVNEKQVPVLVDYLTKNFGPPETSAQAAQPAKDHPGKKILENGCTGCHGIDTVSRLGMNKEGWQLMIENMIGFGAPVTKEEVPMLLEYLVQTYPQKD